MSLKIVLKYLNSHPLTKQKKFSSLMRVLRWQIGMRLNPYPVIVPFINDTKLVVERGMAGATANVYAGLHEFSDMGFLLHFLRESDCFIDAGANIGSYTILASGVRKAKSISFEPSSTTYGKLLRNVRINNLDQLVQTHQIALGSKKGTVNFTKLFDTVNHVLQDETSTNNSEAIALDSMDNIVGTLSLPTLLKIDVEGFETEVLKGADSLLNNNNLKAIIIELNGSGWRYGYDENKIHQDLLKRGFKATQYNPFTRILEETEAIGTHNTVYIRDFEFVNQRISDSSEFCVLGKKF